MAPQLAVQGNVFLAALQLTNIVIALAIIYANKTVLVLGFSPISLIVLQQISMVAVLITGKQLGYITIPKDLEGFFVLNKPLGILVLSQAMGLIFANYSLLLNSVQIAQLAKQAQIPTVLVMEYFFQNKKVSFYRGVALAGLCLGLIVAQGLDVQLNLLGTVCAFLSVVAVSVEIVYNSKIQQESDMDTLGIMYKVIPFALLATVLCALVKEGKQFFSSFNAFVSREHPEVLFWIMVSCLCAFLINYSAIMIAGKSSGLTYTLLGQVKLCLSIAMGMLFFDAPPTWSSVCGVSFAVLMVIIYSFVALREQTEKKKEEATVS